MPSPLFDVPTRSDRQSDRELVNKVKQRKVTAQPSVRGGSGMAANIATIRSTVERNLGKYADECCVITDADSLTQYVSSAMSYGGIAIDTETTGLDPLRDSLVGVCLYTPNEKAVYVPVGHRSYVTGQLVSNQLTCSVVGDILRPLCHNITSVMFNGVFDLRFIWNNLGIDMHCDWDCYLAARLLNENEGAGNNGLKKLHQKYVLRGKEDAFKFDELFKGVNFAYVPISTAYLYAAHDPKITWELYEYQLPYLSPDNKLCKRCHLTDVAWVFHNIEMPCVPVVATMENTGVSFDTEYADELDKKYSIILDEKRAAANKIMDMYSKDIESYRALNGGNKLDDPINIDSPTQLAILLYDIIKVKPVDKKSPRSTGEESLKKIGLPLCNAILEYRGIEKLMNTYIRKLPECVHKDGRIHCKFNLYGADTGRMSSQDPNLQNVPHTSDIRRMFTASHDEYSVVTDNDYFEVEPFTEVHTQSGWIYSDKLKVGDILIVDEGSVESGRAVTSVNVGADKITIGIA